jgi:hypothetical protein
MQANTGATRVYFWGQEIVHFARCCTEMEKVG